MGTNWLNNGLIKWQTIKTTVDRHPASNTNKHEKWSHYCDRPSYTAVQKFGFFLKKLIILFSKKALKWSNLTVKTFTMLQKTYIKAVLLNFVFIKEFWKKKAPLFPQKY